MKTIHYSSKKTGNIAISTDENKVKINTERLELRSSNQNEEHSLIENYTLLLGDPTNVALFAEGESWNKKKVEELVKSEIQKWNDGHRFCMFSIHDAKTGQFMGSLHIIHAKQDYVNIGSGHENVAEIAYILDKSFCGKGYGTEIAIIGKKYIKHIISEGEFNSLESQLQQIVATVHPLNEGSKKILQKTLKHQEAEELIKFGGQPRLLFFKPLNVSNPLRDDASLNIGDVFEYT
ncbi:MAG: GNAT family N-acetyltransferase [Legionella longbeachae]|nr:GNAT family N-acetyltransferase [Legionella longbeachae]